MVIKYASITVTKEEYYRLMEELGGKAYGKYKGLNILLYQNIHGKYFIQSNDHIEQVIK